MRRLVTTAVALVAVMGTAGPAWAHEEINPSSVPTAKPAFFTLSAANEAKADLTELTLTAPVNLAFGATTKAPPGWTVDRTDQVITWSGGAVNPDRFDQWGFEMEGADEPGILTYHLTMNFADGTDNAVDIPITVTAGSAGAAGGPSSTTPPSTSAGTSGGNGRANAALALGASAIVVAGASLALAASRRRVSHGPTAGAGAGSQANDAQDW